MSNSSSWNKLKSLRLNKLTVPYPLLLFKSVIFNSTLMYLFNTNTRKDSFILDTQQIYSFPTFVFKSQVCSLLTQITAFSCFWFGLSLRNVKPPLSLAASAEVGGWYTSHHRSLNSRRSIHYFTVTRWTRPDNNIFTGGEKVAKIDHSNTKNITKLYRPKNCNVQNLLVCFYFSISISELGRALWRTLGLVIMKHLWE